MLISKEVKIKWEKGNKKNFINKGYVFTKYGDIFTVKVEDLGIQSHVYVDVMCDNEICDNKVVKKLRYYNYTKCIKKHGKYYCKKCATKLVAIDKANKKKLTKSISFGDYLINNYGNNAIEKYWSKLNNLNPFEISYCSNKIVFIKCQEKYYHEDYPTTCNNFINGNRCPYCSGKKINRLDSLGYYLKSKNLLNLWSIKNKKSPYEHLPFSNKKVYWKCPEGKHKDYKRHISNSNKSNFRCPECQSSLGEKYIEKYLFNNNIFYIPQKEFDNLLGLNNGKLSYDFYLPEYNLLIEFQGEQHEKPVDFERKGKKHAEDQFKKQQEHDKRKREYAQNNNIKLLEIWYWDFDNIEKILDETLRLEIIVHDSKKIS